METLQNQHIINNLFELIHFTKCSKALLDLLKTRNIFSLEHMDELESMKEQTKQSSKLYEILRNQISAYEEVMNILLETDNLESFAILNQCSSQNISNECSITYSKQMLIGTGSYNTKVYNGMFERWSVAVKQIILKDIVAEKAIEEIQLLKKLDSDRNILQYYNSEVSSQFLLVAVEFCDVKLKTWMSSNSSLLENSPWVVLTQLAAGLEYLHSNNLVHGCLKPKHIYITNGHLDNFKIKLSSFGTSKYSSLKRCKLSVSSSNVLKYGWTAPEILKVLLKKDIVERPKNSFKADVFSLGCIFYYVVSSGDHPFGNKIERVPNIVHGKSNLDSTKIDNCKLHVGSRTFILLLSDMLANEDTNRPTSSVVLCRLSEIHSIRKPKLMDDLHSGGDEGLLFSSRRINRIPIPTRKAYCSSGKEDLFTVGKECSISRIISTLQSSELFELFAGQWCDFARSLGSSESYITEIRSNLILKIFSLADVFYKILEDWVARSGEDVSLQVLINKLEENCMKSFGELLRNEFVYTKQTVSWKDLAVGDQQCRIVTIVDIIGTYTKIHDNWVDLAIQLNISEEQIRKFRKDAIHVAEITHSDLLYEILRIWVGKNGSNAKLTVLLDVVEKKLGWVNVGELLRLEFNLPCYMSDYDKPSKTWEDLSPAFQDRVQENLQTTLPNLQWKTCLADLSGVVLLDLMTGTQPRLFKTKLPEKLSYYVSRRILTRNVISSKIFKMNSSCIFTFTGMERHELSRLANDLTSSSRDQLREVTVKFMILEQLNHFDKICEKTTKPVHLLHQDENGKLKWVKSRGCMNEVQTNVDGLQDEIAEEEFIELLNPSSNLPICISDTPGMGKSVLLAQIGIRLVEKFPDRAVVFIVLSDFIQHVKQSEKTVKVMHQAIANVLQDLICENEFSRILLKSIFADSKVAFELLLDGLDELDPLDFGFAIKILQIIKNSFKFVRLWVTTRPHMLNELENSLSVLGYNMLPFDITDQLKFLSLYWSKGNNIDTERLYNVAKHCLNSFNMRISLEDNAISGIPLQCLLIGVIYEEEAISFANYRSSNLVFVTPINSITDFYKLLIVKKIEKYLQVHMSTEFAGIENILDIHIRLSLELLFPDYFDNLKHLFDFVDYRDLVKVGLVESNGTNGQILPRFIHRTFAEYFIAWFIWSRLCVGSWHKDLNDFFLEGVLGRTNSNKFYHHVICFFLNSLMTDTIRTVHSELSGFFCNEISNSHRALKELSHACAYSNYFNIIDFFNQIKAFEKIGGTIFSDDLILIAVKYSGLELIKLALQQFEQHHTFELNLQINALITAIEVGKFAVVEFLVKEKQLQRLVKGLHPEYGSKGLLHACVEATRYKERDPENAKFKLDERCQVLRLLVSINASLLEEKDGDGRTPLLANNAHVHLLKELINLGANTSARYQDEGTIIHIETPRNCFSPEEFHDLLTSIPKKYLQKLADFRNWVGQTPLICSVKHIDPLSETFKILNDAGADFNSLEENGYSVLAIAIQFRRSTETMHNMILHGSNVNWLSRNGDTLFHLAAARGTCDALQLLEKHSSKKLKEITNSKLQTLLHVAAREGNVNATCLLLKNGLNGNMQDENGNTALHCCLNNAHIKNHFQITKLLLTYGADVNIPNNLEETALQTAFKIEYLDLETNDLLTSVNRRTTNWTKESSHQALVTRINCTKNSEDLEFTIFVQECEKHGVSIDLTYKDPDGNSMLHIALKSQYHRALRYLVEEKCADVNSTNKQQQTLLHVAAHGNDPEQKLKIIKYLIKKGTSPYPKDADGFTFLHHYISKTLQPQHLHSIMEFLIERDCGSIFGTGGGSQIITPLHQLVRELEPLETSLWLLHSVNIDFNAVDIRGLSVLAYAVVGGRSTKFLSSLLTKFSANIQHRDKRINNILHFTASHGTLEAVNFFLNYGALDVNATNTDGNTALHCATMPSGNCLDTLEKCKLLINHGADVNIRNLYGETALHYAALLKENICLTLVFTLLDLGADPFTMNANGFNFLQCYLSKPEAPLPEQFHSLVEYLVKINLCSLFHTVSGETGCSPLHTAIEKLELQQHSLDLLHSTGINFNITDKNGCTVLTRAIQGKRSAEIISKFIRYGADWRALSNHGNSVLHFAAQFGTLETLKLFLDIGGLDVNGIDKDGDTPLHCAVSQTDTSEILEKCRCLISFGSDTSIKNNNGNMPLSTIKKRDLDVELIELLSPLELPDRINFGKKKSTDGRVNDDDESQNKDMVADSLDK